MAGDVVLLGHDEFVGGMAGFHGQDFCLGELALGGVTGGRRVVEPTIIVMGECASCSGTGRNWRGSPCRYCRGSGWAPNVAHTAGLTLDEFGRAMSEVTFALIVIFVVVCIVAANF